MNHRGSILSVFAIGCGLVCTVLIGLSVMVVGYCVSTLNTEVRLRNQVVAQQKANEPSFDTMWKIISGKAQIVDKYKKDFKEIWPDLIAGRYSSGGGLMKWIQERNPDYDSSLYKDLMGSVESERKRFLRDQQQLIDYNREHDVLVDSPISGFVIKMLGDPSKIEIKIVTSAETQQAFSTQQENDTKIFK